MPQHARWLTCGTSINGHEVLVYMVPSVQNILFPYVDEHHSSFMEEWEQFIAQLHLTIQPSHIHNTQEFMVAQLQHIGMEAWSIAPDIPLIYAEFCVGAPRTLLLYYTYTVQPFDEGSFASIAACMAGITAYQKVSGPLPVNIKWLIAGEKTMESAQWEEILATHRDLLQADACIWSNIGQMGDMTPFLALGTKGLLRIELEVRTNENALPSHYGAVAPNAAWRLLWTLSSIKDPHEDIRIEGFYDTLVPAEDDEVALLHTLLNSATTPSMMPSGEPDIVHPLLDLGDFQLYYAYLLTPTCTIYNITSGDRATPTDLSQPTLPTCAKASVDFHLVPNQDPDDIFTQLQRHLQTLNFHDVQVRKLAANRPAHTPLTDPFVQTVKQATRAAYGQEPRILPMTAESYPLSPLQRTYTLPIVITTTGFLETAAQSADGSSYSINPQAFACAMKQIALIIEEFSRGTDTTA